MFLIHRLDVQSNELIPIPVMPDDRWVQVQCHGTVHEFAVSANECACGTLNWTQVREQNQNQNQKQRVHEPMTEPIHEPKTEQNQMQSLNKEDDDCYITDEELERAKRAGIIEFIDKKEDETVKRLREMQKREGD